MKLNKRYVRSIRENLSFYISSIVLTAMALLMFFMFHIAGKAILEFSADFFPAHNLEDANFTTYLPVSDIELEELEKEYNLTLEAERYINIETDGVTARVFHRTEKIDLYEITVGADVENDGEIVISEGFAVNMDISLGDLLRIGEKSYTVVGFFQRPDYLYMLENEDDSYKNISTFYLAYMTDGAFEQLGDTLCRYLVRYGEDNSTEFRKAIHETYYMRSYTPAEENMRIAMVDEQAQLFLIMSYVILCILPLIAVALVSIIISRKVKSEQRMIGTLSALGYKKSQLMRHYAGFAALPGLVGGILTAVISAFVAQPYSELGLQDYEPMRVRGHLDPLAVALGIVVPTAMYVIAALLSVRKLLKKDTVLLLNANADAGEKKRKRLLAGSRISFRKKYAIRSLVGNPARGFVVFLGIFLGSFIALFGFSMFDSIYATKDVVYDTGSYEYQYILSELMDENPYGGKEMLVSAVEDGHGHTITLLGTSGDNPYLNFQDRSGNDVDIGDGYYISTLTAHILGWQEGDEVTLYNPLSLEKTEITIDGILQNDTGKLLFTSLENAAELNGLEPGMYNALISEEQLDIPEAKVSEEIRKSSLGDQLQTVIDQMDFMIYLMIGLGVIICVAAVYVAVNMMVTENRSNISMLKVLGYQDRQIDHIVLDANHVFLPLGILLSIPAALGAVNLSFLLCADLFGMLIKAAINPASYLITIVLTAASYLASLLLVRRKVKRVDLIESLKDTRD